MTVCLLQAGIVDEPEELEPEIEVDDEVHKHQVLTPAGVSLCVLQAGIFGGTEEPEPDIEEIH
jgi:hypothetical protein